MNEDDLDQERLGNLETLEKRSNRLRGGVTTFVGIVFLITGPIVGYDITHSLVWSFVVGYACLFGIIVGPAILINFLIVLLQAAWGSAEAVTVFRENGLSPEQVRTVTSLIGYAFSRKVRRRVYQPGFSELWQDYKEVRARYSNRQGCVLKLVPEG